MQSITIEGTTYTADFTIEELAQMSGKSQKEIEALFRKEKQKQALVELSDLADYYHNFISPASPQKLARYEDKAKAAAAYASASSASAEIKAVLQPEANERGLSLEAHSKAILTAKAKAMEKTAIIEAIYAKQKLAIKRARSLKRMDILVTQASAEFKKAIKG